MVQKTRRKTGDEDIHLSKQKVLEQKKVGDNKVERRFNFPDTKPVPSIFYKHKPTRGLFSRNPFFDSSTGRMIT